MRQKKFSKKAKAGLILLALCFSVLAYLQVAACKELRQQKEMQDYFSKPGAIFSNPTIHYMRLLPDVFYKMCPADTAVNNKPQEE